MRNWIVLAITLLILAPQVNADPPSRIARIQQLQGEMSFLPAGSQEWVRATRNRPLIRGDSLWNDNNTKSIVQLDNTAMGLGANTNLNILDLNDSVAQFQLNQGSINLYIKRIRTDQRISIATPNLAFTVTKPGYYRVKVSTDGFATTVTVREGSGQVDGRGMSYKLSKNQSFQFVGKELRRPQLLALTPKDGLDKWFDQHAVRKKTTTSARYVSAEVIGYEDLDRYGKWVVTKEYGHVWTPTKVAKNWAPYRYGHWNWVEPWGWTWVGDEPWGFAPYHYGRWVYSQHHWYWIPVAAKTRAVYAPALVAFVGGTRAMKSNAPANVTWFPLAPGEIYRPSYKVSQTYFTNVNTTNTTINQTVINQAYSHPAAPVNYRNLQAPNAVTAVPSTTFVNAKPVEKALVKIDAQQVTPVQVTQAAPVPGDRRPVPDASAAAKVQPSAQVLTREVVVQTPAQAKETETVALPPTTVIHPEPVPAPASPVNEPEKAPTPKEIAPSQRLEPEKKIEPAAPVGEPQPEPKHPKPVHHAPAQSAPVEEPSQPVRHEPAQPERRPEPTREEAPVHPPEPAPQMHEPVQREEPRHPEPVRQEPIPEPIRQEPVAEPAPKVVAPPPQPEPIVEPAPVPVPEEIKPEEKLPVDALPVSPP